MHGHFGYYKHKLSVKGKTLHALFPQEFSSCRDVKHPVFVYKNHRRDPQERTKQVKIAHVGGVYLN